MAHLRIKELAKEQGILQYELASKSGVTVQLLSRYWNNSTQRVELRSLELIAHALGVKAGDLIVDGETGKGEKPKEPITEENDEEDDDIDSQAIIQQALERIGKLAS